ncbi:MAG: hypothetical protein JXA97_03325 [Anaerolineales bacterium]|nr:hypothetical protein [Anaerolineales bacterium]
MKKHRSFVVILILILLLMSGCEGAPVMETPSEPVEPSPTFLSLPEPTESSPAAPTEEPAAPLPTVAPAEPLSEEPRIAFNDLQMIDASTGFAIIDYNESYNQIMRTQDGGSTWIDITPAGTPDTTCHISFFDADHGWAAFRSDPDLNPSSAYTIWRTVDGGETWQTSTPMNMSDIDVEGINPQAFFFLNPQTGWFRAGTGPAGMHKSYITIYRTTNGGQTWTRMMDPYTDTEIYSFPKTGMVFADASYGWITRDSRGVEWGVYVHVTEDGGATWRSIALPEPADAPGLYEGGGWCGAFYPRLAGRGRGSLVVSCEIYEDDESTYQTYLYTTADGGLSWTYLAMPPGELFRFPGSLVAAGRSVYQSTDGGENWDLMNSVDFYPGSYSFIDPLNGWVFAQWQDQPAALMRTANGGRFWEPIDLTIASARSAGAEISDVDITAITMVDAARGWAIGARPGENDRILVTDNGGDRWIDATPPEPLLATSSGVTALSFFLDADHAWVTFDPGSHGTPDAVSIWRTSDGGRTWSSSALPGIASLISSYAPYHMFFVDEALGWFMAAVDAGMQKVYSVIYATSDGGATWSLILDPTTDIEVQSFDKTGMVFSDASHGWITYDGRGVEPGLYVLLTSDGGVTWTPSALPEPAGETGLFNSSVCGTYWPVMYSLNSGSVIGRCTSYGGDAASVVEYIYTTSDGGASWTFYPYPGGQLIVFTPVEMAALAQNMYTSADGGESWDFLKTVSWQGKFSFTDTEHGWAIARAGDEIALVRTDDGGGSWDLLEYRVFLGE